MKEQILRQIVYLLEPIGFIWACLIILTAALCWKRQWRFAVASGFIVALVTIVGGSPLAGMLLSSLERPYAGVEIDKLPTADAIVLLGGGASPSRYEAGGIHLTPAGDRIVMAHALFKLNKAPVLLLGGNANKLDNVIRYESELVRDLYLSWGVPREAMIPMSWNADTYDESLRVRNLAAERGWKRILLVTSANHQRRASATFRAQGLEVISVPCNFLTSVSTAPAEQRFSIPRYDGFVRIATYLHEEIGWLMYRRRGWIKE